MAEDLTTEQKLAVFQSRDFAEQAREQLAAGDRAAAATTALKGLPPDLDDADYETHFAEALKALYDARRSRSVSLPLTEQVHFSISPTGDRSASTSMRVTGTDVGAPVEPLTLWDTETGERVARLLPPEESATEGHTIGAASFSMDGRLVASGVGETGVVQVWTAVDGEPYRKLLGHAPDVVNVIGFSANSRYLSSFGGGGHELRAWDVETGETVLTVPFSQCHFPVPVLNPGSDGIWYINNPIPGRGCNDAAGTLLHLDPATGKTTDILTAEHAAGSWSVTFSDDGTLATVRREDGILQVFDIASGERVVEIPASRTARPSCALPATTAFWSARARSTTKPS
ncbi:WD40 repeat domain-containing protein [Rhodobacteraceae bacterium NNCM2]|nr:WD40 repeat domain-containing protein [Coraliihabitans acroporae]